MQQECNALDYACTVQGMELALALWNIHGNHGGQTS